MDRAASDNLKDVDDGSFAQNRDRHGGVKGVRYGDPVLLLVGLGLAVGHALSRIVPGIDLGIATLCGVAAVGFSGLALVGLLVTASKLDSADKPDDEEADQDEKEFQLSDEQYELITGHISDMVMTRMSQTRPRSRPRTKR